MRVFYKGIEVYINEKGFTVLSSGCIFNTLEELQNSLKK